MTESARKSRVPLVAHVVWGIAGLAICALLVLSRGGHPPAIVFLPLAVIVWAVGHAAIWAAARIAARGRRIASEAGLGAQGWPPALVAVLVLTGLASAVGIVQLVVTLVMGSLYPTGPPGMWTLTMVLWIVHGVCFAGVLLRKRWSRHLSAVLSIGWAALLIVQIVDHLVHGRRVDAVEMSVAVAIVLALAAIAFHLYASERVRSFLAG